MSAGRLEFNWDEANVRHLRRHRISSAEFQEVLLNDHLDLEYQTEGGEERYKSLGVTDGGRIMVIVWTIRKSRIRAVTAYTASWTLRRLYGEYREGASDAQA